MLRGPLVILRGPLVRLRGPLIRLRGLLVRLRGPLIRLDGFRGLFRGSPGGWVGYLILMGPWLFWADSRAQGLGLGLVLGLEAGLVDLRCGPPYRGRGRRD